MRNATILGAAAAALTLAGCSSQRDVLPPPDPEPGTAQTSAPASDPAQGGFVIGGRQNNSKFVTPAQAPSTTPDINTVPAAAPQASSKEERDKILTGLIADRNNARYADQGGRTLPVAVRPLTDTPADQQNAVDRLGASPPERPAEAEQVEFDLSQVNRPSPDVGPRAPGVAPVRTGTGEGSSGAAGLGDYRPLSEVSAGSFGKSTLAGTLSLQGGNLSSNDRKVLNTAARSQIDSRGRGVLRVVGHGAGGAERAVIAANELVRLGVAKSNIFVGADNITGPTEVFFDREK